VIRLHALASFLFASNLILAQESPSFQEDGLFFPLQKTDSQILPQRFEYHLLNKDQIRIGNILMDANKINFQLVAKNKTDLNVRFQWPAGLLTKGEIVIKDNTGKALWRRLINERLIKIEEQTIQMQGDTYNGNIASYETEGIDLDTVRKIKMYPFFRFCAQTEEQLTKIYLCSKEMYFKTAGKRSLIQTRDSFRQESYVEINGQIVGDMGMVYLQSTRDPISMRAKLLSGATLELDTRLKNIDFKDIWMTADKKIIIKASGTEPVLENLILARTDDGWTSELKRIRPFVYIKGEGGIPMKQEFIIGSNIRPENLKILYEKKPNFRTYSSSETVYLKADPSITLESEDQKTKLEKISETEWKWEIGNLHKNNKSRAYLSIRTEKEKYTAAHDIFRAKRHELTGSLLLTQISLALNYHYWLNQRFGFLLRYENYIQKGASDPTFSLFAADLLYRFSPGIHLLEPSHGLRIGYENLILDSTSVGTITVGGYLTYLAPRSMESLSNYLILNLKVPTSASAGNYTLQSGYTFEILSKKLEPSWNWEMGLRQQTYQLNTNTATTSLSRFSILFGMGTQF